MKFPIGIVLFIVFLVLKLTETIDWSWWWITSPIWIPAAILAVAYATTGAITALVYKAAKK